jgi:enamine deaminase RidA (YjgF/YER057c/UK114 family)
MSQVAIHGGTIYLGGQVGTLGAGITEQTRQVLASIDRLLAEAGSDRSHILQAIVWLADMADFDAMNAVWDGWVDRENAPVRACGQSQLADPGYRVEIIVTAAVA